MYLCMLSNESLLAIKWVFACYQTGLFFLAKYFLYAERYFYLQSTTSLSFTNTLLYVRCPPTSLYNWSQHQPGARIQNIRNSWFCIRLCLSPLNIHAYIWLCEIVMDRTHERVSGSTLRRFWWYANEGVKASSFIKNVNLLAVQIM